MLFKRFCVCSMVLLMEPFVKGLTIKTKRSFVKTTDIDLEWFKQTMVDTFNYAYNYTMLINSLHVFEYKANDELYIDVNFHTKLIDHFNGSVVYVEPITINNDVFATDPIPVSVSSYLKDVRGSKSFDNYLIEGQSYGMGVQEAWARGYNGLGVVIASTDVGADIYNPDLLRSINISLSHNFVSDDPNDLSPNRFTEDDVRLSSHLTDHGNRCVGLLVAVKDNGICCAGIAFGAKAAVLKIFTVDKSASGHSTTVYTNEFAANGLNHKLQDIDIFSNSWLFKYAFDLLGQAMHDVLETGINNGRQGKGTIYVFPSGPIAEGFANSRYTITVSSINKHGNVSREYVELCAAVLTSVYGEGVRLNGSYMVTTSHPTRNCTIEFKGTSASTAMVSGIIALTLQANKNLSWRDVQHLVVRASHKEGLLEAENFKPNGAGHYYHSELGFGLLDAFTLITMAIDWQNVGPEVFQKEVSKDFKSERNSIDVYSIARVTVASKTKSCVTQVEHVVIELGYTTPNENNLEITLMSPYGTQSILMEVKQSTVTNAQVRSNVKFTSVHFWDEQANGTWKLMLKQNSYTKAQNKKICAIVTADFGITYCSFTIHGTNDENYDCINQEQEDRAENVTGKTEDNTKDNEIIKKGNTKNVKQIQNDNKQKYIANTLSRLWYNIPKLLFVIIVSGIASIVALAVGMKKLSYENISFVIGVIVFIIVVVIVTLVYM